MVLGIVFMKWLIVILIQVIFFQVATGSAEIRRNLGECIEIALKNQPSLRVAEAELKAGKAREKQAVSGYLPQIAASTGYTETHQDGGAFGDNINKGYTTSLSLNQIIYDFGRTGNAYDAACLNTRSAELDAERVKQDVILKVKQEYFDLLQSQRLVVLAQKTLEQSESHLKQAKAFYNTGTKPEFDVTRAEVDVNNQQLSLINAKNRMHISRMVLNNAMGIDPERQIEIDDNLAMPPVIPPLEKVKAEALENRSDLRKVESDIAAAAARIQVEKSNHLPAIALNGNYNWTDGTSEMGMFKGDVRNSWNAGIAVTLPIYEGGLTSGKIHEAKSNKQVLKAQRDMLQQTVLIEVYQYYADMESARVCIQVMERSLKKANENLDIAQGRYEEGVGPYIDVTDAQVSAVKAEIDYVQSLYDFQLDAAMLLRAMGKGEQLQGTME